ncbi:3-phosphoshikimate 1-carboxyvinyltransferase [Litorihabitans aurantiacus]|uniref:3-phosphoshikimate 1-carboxyvinyltransferase n=1 Tax=Litorihabitans aurantiacus TaxID=1930061 RepID=A0AA37XD20_9MICO|nr:3-phosphoshikimate 1-carboxyvinyltransferase [Litorihabitans aurantiacus]GMA30660.1 3-phosphoshikimate 1-carboxyvinyltransferase 1 [Litorihabitans aurantiacus]
MTAPSWAAPHATTPLDATVEVPGSKSLTNRYLLLAAIAAEPTHLVAPLHSRDSALMIEAIRALGAGVAVEPGGDVHVTPAATITGGGTIDVGLAGTVMRFVPPLAALADGDVHLDGDARARERPMAAVTRALGALGVAVTHDGEPTDAFPLTVHGTGGLEGGEIEIDASSSSQFVSALLLVAPRMRNGLTLTHVGDTLPSQPHIDMTLAVLRERGVEARELGHGRWRVEPGMVAGGRVVVEPDLSNAGPFLAAALAAGGTVRVPRWPATTTQPGDDLRDILTAMGARVVLDGDTLAVTGTGTLRGLDLDLSRAGELAPTLAALAVLADSPTRLRGIGHLRGHETDRLAALVTEITRLGGSAHELPDGLAIDPAPLHGAVVETYHDHRMATFGAVVGLAVAGVEVLDVATTAKTLPDFPGMWRRMLAPGGTPTA